MNVSEIVQLIANQGLGNDTPTLADQTIYLRYLNMAHKELYRAVKILDPARASVNADIIITNGAGDLPANIMRLTSAINEDRGRKLAQKTLDWIEDNDPLVEQTGDPAYWYFGDGNRIFTYPRTTHDLRIRYIPQAQNFTLETLEAAIPYPIEHHPILVDGALYYLFQSEGGFKSGTKAAGAQVKWLRGKAALCNDIESYVKPAEPATDY
jgi:hypothetical protein